MRKYIPILNFHIYVCGYFLKFVFRWHKEWEKVVVEMCLLLVVTNSFVSLFI